MATIGIIALFLFGAWASFMIGLLMTQVFGSGGIESLARDFYIAAFCAIVWCCSYIWWLSW